MNPAMDVQITRALFDRCLDAPALLGLDDPWLDDVVAAARALLPPPKIGSDGRLMEWDEELVEWEPGHRHLSHLFGAFPDDQLLADGDPAVIGAITKSLAAPAGQQHAEWLLEPLLGGTGVGAARRRRPGARLAPGHARGMHVR